MKTKRNTSRRIRKLQNRIKDTYSTCFFCGENLDRADRTINHIVAISKGGADYAYNYLVACRNCNVEKDNMDFYEYLKLKLEGFDFTERSKLNQGHILMKKI